MEKYIKTIEELKLVKRIAGGSCSEIYLYTPEIYFKYFNEDYRDLTDEINIELLETLKTLSQINNMPSIIRAIDIYRSNLELFGYTMFKVNAEKLEDITNNTPVLDLVNSFEKLKPEIRILSNNYVKTEDIGGDNILYNGTLYLLDLDLSLVDKRYIPDELYAKTTYSVFIALLQRIVGKIYDDEMNRFRRELKLGKSDEHMGYFKKLIERCSENAGEEVRTLKDVRKAYKKTYKIVR